MSPQAPAPTPAAPQKPKMPSLPTWLYHPEHKAKVVRTFQELIDHLEDGWDDKPFPVTPKDPPKCAGCELLRKERDELQSRLSAITAEDQNLAGTAADSAPNAAEAARSAKIDALGNLFPKNKKSKPLKSDDSE